MNDELGSGEWGRQGRLVLASQSPRRRALLGRLGLDFDVVTADVDETARGGEEPQALVQRLAREKALAVVAQLPQRPVLAADTVVVLDGQVLGKPADPAEATATLRSLRGRAHLVLSAVYLWNPAMGREAAELSVSSVWMRPYGDEEIAAYVASGDPLDKAGAYAIQSLEFAPVARIEGCFSGVMGLPLAHVARALAHAGIEAPVTALVACAPVAGRCCQQG